MAGRYTWDQPIRFALSAEEAGYLIAKLPTMETVEFARKTRTEDDHAGRVSMGSMQKVFRAFPHGDGSVQLVIDYELDGEPGQEPPSSKEAVGFGVAVVEL